MADACCDPIMDLSQLHARQRRVLRIVLAINVATFLMVVAGAYLSKSTSLLSGGLDNFGDALTYALSLLVVGASLAAQSRVALVKGLLILGAAIAVAGQVAYRLLNPTVPIFETMGIVGLVNLAANATSLWLLTPYRHGDINMASAWECSRNDIYEGTAVLAAAGLVFAFDAGWPDLLVAVGLLALFSRSAVRVLRDSIRGIRTVDAHAPGPGKVQDVVCKCFIDARTAGFRSRHGGRDYHFCNASCKSTFDANPEAYASLPMAPLVHNSQPPG
jgi:Co/Zn/Cd efflux system component